MTEQRLQRIVGIAIGVFMEARHKKKVKREPEYVKAHQKMKCAQYRRSYTGKDKRRG